MKTLLLTLTLLLLTLDSHAASVPSMTVMINTQSQALVGRSTNLFGGNVALASNALAVSYRPLYNSLNGETNNATGVAHFNNGSGAYDAFTGGYDGPKIYLKDSSGKWFTIGASNGLLTLGVAATLGGAATQFLTISAAGTVTANGGILSKNDPGGLSGLSSTTFYSNGHMLAGFQNAYIAIGRVYGSAGFGVYPGDSSQVVDTSLVSTGPGAWTLATNLTVGGLLLPTNAAPSSVTLGVTAVDQWFQIKNLAGNSYFVPGWTNH